MSKRIPILGMYTAEQAAKLIAYKLDEPNKVPAYYKRVIILAKEGKLKYELSGKNNCFWNFDKESIENLIEEELKNRDMNKFVYKDLENTNDLKEPQVNQIIIQIKKIIELHEEINISPKVTLAVIKEIIK